MLERVTSAQGIRHDCVAHARTLAPLIAAHAGATEQAREIAPQVIDALHEAQLFRLLIPRSCDGFEADP